MYILIIILCLAVAIITAISLSRNFPVPENLKQYGVTAGVVIGIIFLCGLLTLSGGCSINPDNTTVIRQETDDTQETEPIIYEAMLYDNQGNNFLSFYGNRFSITPNRIRQYGYDTDGNWSSWYETSSVMTIEIDGQFIQSCGSTVIFKDKRLAMLDIPGELKTVGVAGDDGYRVSAGSSALESCLGLKNWWYDMKEKGQHGEKVILIQSQDGYNIGAFTGSEITWGVAGKLPKTTEVMIDGLPLYIHRCNFTIIDSSLMENPVE